jgi:Glycosyl transferase family 2
MAYTTPLCPLMDKYGSDKGPRVGNTTHHTYTTEYHELFKDMVDRTLNVFELGLGTNNAEFPSNMGPNGRPGASLRAWREYFPHSSIYGADIDKGVLFEEDRIHTTYCDQTNPSVVRSMWESLPDMDIIIDDGLHTFDANVIFFENSIHKLKPTGIFVIEDIDKHDLQRFRSKIEEWQAAYPSHLFRLRLLEGGNPCDNNVLVVTPVSISVCIPTMRRFSFLKESIPKYLANPHVTELVIVDETGEDYAAITAAFSHSKLRVYRNDTRLGVLKNKLRAASYATSDFIAILDSDNLADVGYFQAFKRFYSAHVFSDSAIFLPSFARPRFDYREWVGRPIDKTNVRNFLPRIETCLNTMNLIISRSYMNRLTILDDKPTCDQVSCYDSQYFTLYSMFVMNATLFVVDRMEYEHRVHDESWWIISHPTEGDKSYHELRQRFLHTMDLVTWQRSPKPDDCLIVQASSTNEDDAWMPFPIGMNYTYPGTFRFGDHSQSVLCAMNPYTDSRRRPQGKNRHLILAQLAANGISNTHVSPDVYFDVLPSYKFVISPEGNGIDCHRHYEALIAGCIPIIERNPLTEEKYRGCPVLWTTDYSEITPAYLDTVYESMKGQVYDFSRLFLSYYPPNVQAEIKRCGNYWMTRHGKAPFY